jgi:hypothetical protein
MGTKTVIFAYALKVILKHYKLHGINIKNSGVNFQLKHRTSHGKNIKTLESINFSLKTRMSTAKY